MKTMQEIKEQRKNMILTLTKSIKDDVSYSIKIYPEDIPIKGYASCIDPKTDLEVEQAIIEQLESGNQWAWCSVEVIAEYKGLTASDYLGCCSYESEDDFKQAGGYYDDMKQIAFEQLVENLQELQVSK